MGTLEEDDSGIIKIMDKDIHKKKYKRQFIKRSIRLYFSKLCFNR
ncbi:hypothetical protein [Heyndrickxia sporothermodurans]|nr:hypothetical protein [Heyndrickxia sporothermodurans]